jgi:hypothetical protein
MGERVACPECGRYVGITPLGFVRRHLATGSDAECRVSRLTLAYVRETVARPQIPSRPTVLTMGGETTTTGEDGPLDTEDNYDARACDHWVRVAPWEATRQGFCPAPTPRAP